MSKVFIFSTRYSFLYYQNDNDFKTAGKYLFWEKNCEEDQYTFDTSALFDPTPEDKKTIIKIFLELESDKKEIYKTEFFGKLEGSNEVKEEIWRVKIVEQTEKLSTDADNPIKNEEKYVIDVYKSDYYKIKNQPPNYCKIKDKEIYAVSPYDKINKRNEWIECLLNLNDSTKNEENEIFLLLHDKDIYPNGEPFKVLEKEEIKGLKNRNMVNILVYQHEKNPATDILRTSDLNNIEEKIESIFYKYPLKKALLAYVDELFYPQDNNRVIEKKDVVIQQYNKHKSEYQKISKELPDFSEEKTLKISPLKKEEMDKLNNWIKLLS